MDNLFNYCLVLDDCRLNSFNFGSHKYPNLFNLREFLLNDNWFISPNCKHGGVSKTGIVMNIQELSGLVRLDNSTII